MSITSEEYSTVPLFDNIEPLKIADFLEIAENMTVHKCEIVFQAGDCGDGFFVISRGRFEVKLHDKSLAILGELSFFGEMSLLSNTPRSATVICKEPGRLKFFPKEKFLQRLQDNNLVAYKVIHNMSRIMAARLERIDEEYSACSNAGAVKQ